MRKINLLILIIFLFFSYTQNSFAFFAGLSKGAQVLFKIAGASKKTLPAITKSKGALTGISATSKLTAIDILAASSDDIAREALAIKQLDKNLIKSISDQEYKNVFATLKYNDDVALKNYKNIDAPANTIKDEPVNLQTHLISARHGFKDLKKEPTVYVCETNNKQTYFFSLLPKRNTALVTSDTEVGKQKLKIIRSDAQNSYFTTYPTGNEITHHFVMLPNYKALIYDSKSFSIQPETLNDYGKKDSTTNSINKLINAECYDLDPNTSTLERVEVDLKKLEEIYEDQYRLSAASKLANDAEKDSKYDLIFDNSIKRFYAYLIFFVLFLEFVILPLVKKHEITNKNKFHILSILRNVYAPVNVVSLNFLSWYTCFMYFAFNWKTWYEVCLVVLFIFCIFGIFTSFKESFLILRKSEAKKYLSLSQNIYAYSAIILPSLFVISIIIIGIYGNFFL